MRRQTVTIARLNGNCLSVNSIMHYHAATVKLRYNVFLRTEKNSTLYLRYVVTM